MSKRLRLAALTALAMMPAVVGLAAEAEHGGGGMPQLRFNDPLLIGQVVWLLVIFGVLYVLMSRWALPGVARVLAIRRGRIDGDLEAARAAKDRADAAMTDHRNSTARARSEAQSAIATAVARAHDELTVQTDAMNAKLARQIEAAEVQINAARNAAMGALRQVSADTAAAVVARLAGGADRGAVDAAVDRELASRGHA